MGRRGVLPAVILFLALVSAIGATPACNLAGDIVYKTATSDMIKLAVLLTIGIIALAKMYAEAVNSVPLQAWVKAELWEVVVTVFLVASIPIFAGILDHVTCNFLGDTPNPALPVDPANTNMLYHCGWATDPGGGSRTIFTVSKFFLGCSAGEGVLLKKLSKVYVDLMAFEFTMAGLASWQFNIPLPAYTVVVSSIMIMPYSGTNPVADAHVFIVDAVGLALASIAAQNMLLGFVESVVIAAFLPLGVLFRAIPITRKVGSTIIAVVFVAYFVYPSTVVLSYHAYNHIKAIDFLEYKNKIEFCKEQDPVKINESINKTLAQLEQQQSEFFGPTAPTRGGFSKFLHFLGAGTEWVFTWAYRTYTTFGDPFGVFRLVTGHENTDFMLTPADTTLYLFESVIDETTVAGQLLAFMTLSLVMSIIITITLFRDISTVMGGEGRIIGISKLV
jgi:hypothetical protein